MNLKAGQKVVVSAIDENRALLTVQPADYTKMLVGLGKDVWQKLGGGIALATVAKDKRVKSVIAFSPRLKFKDFILKYFSEEDIKRWKKEGMISYYDKRRDKTWRYKKTFLEDCLKVDVTSMVNDIKVPALLIQGKDDHNVPIQENKKFFNDLNHNQIYMIDNCDHHYSNIEALYQAVQKATDWFKETLS